MQGYFLEKPDRSNLKVLTFATARRVIFKEDSNVSDGKERLEEAEGVEFEYNGATHIVKAKHEVILAAGYVLIALDQAVSRRSLNDMTRYIKCSPFIITPRVIWDR